MRLRVHCTYYCSLYGAIFACTYLPTKQFSQRIKFYVGCWYADDFIGCVIHRHTPIYRRPQSTAVLTIFSEVLDGIYQLHMFKYATYGATHSQGHSGCTATRSQKAENAGTVSVQIYWSIDLQSTHSSKSSWFLSSPASMITILIQSISTSLENLQPLASSCTCRAQIRSYFNWQMDG